VGSGLKEVPQMSEAAGSVLLAGRIVMSLLFYYSAYGHVRRDAQMRSYAQQVGMPASMLAGWPAGLWLLVAAVSVSFGIWADLGSLMLALWMIPTALLFHNFWKNEDRMQRLTQMQMFLRNLTLFGSSMVLFAVFAGLDEHVPYTITDPLFHLGA
jgi:putative oxidoreductase